MELVIGIAIGYVLKKIHVEYVGYKACIELQRIIEIADEVKVVKIDKEKAKDEFK